VTLEHTLVQVHKLWLPAPAPSGPPTGTSADRIPQNQQQHFDGDISVAAAQGMADESGTCRTCLNALWSSRYCLIYCSAAFMEGYHSPHIVCCSLLPPLVPPDRVPAVSLPCPKHTSPACCNCGLKDLVLAVLCWHHHVHMNSGAGTAHNV
jgi:hypothetical protein